MAKKVAFSGVFAACALIFSYVEYMVPINIGVPGIKPGLANIVIIIALYGLGVKYALAINIVRVIMSALLFSGVLGMAFGLTGGILSVIVMAALLKLDIFSIAGISAVGGIIHNMGQLLVAAIVIADFAVFYYFPVLLISGALTGFFVGLLANIVIKRGGIKNG